MIFRIEISVFIIKNLNIPTYKTPIVLEAKRPAKPKRYFFRQKKNMYLFTFTSVEDYLAKKREAHAHVVSF